jgi:hypothetical protein
MKKPIPGLNTIVEFTGKHSPRAASHADYVQWLVDSHLKWFLKKRLIRQATAAEMKRWRSPDVLSPEYHKLLENYLLTWRGYDYLSTRKHAGTKLEGWEDWMTEHLRALELGVRGFGVVYSRREFDEAIGQAFKIGKLACLIGAVRNDPSVGTGRPVREGSPKGNKTKKKLAAEKARQHDAATSASQGELSHRCPQSSRPFSGLGIPDSRKLSPPEPQPPPP